MQELHNWVFYFFKAKQWWANESFVRRNKHIFLGFNICWILMRQNIKTRGIKWEKGKWNQKWRFFGIFLWILILGINLCIWKYWFKKSQNLRFKFPWHCFQMTACLHYIMSPFWKSMKQKLPAATSQFIAHTFHVNLCNICSFLDVGL